MSLVTPAAVAALHETGLGTADLQAVIDREEGWLADDPMVGIGQLADERELEIRPRDLYADIWLQRIPDPESLVVADNGVELTGAQVALVGAATIRRLDRPWVGPIVTVTLTPADEGAVKRAVIALVLLTVTGSPYQQESTEGHSYSRPTDVDAAREKIARALHPHRGGMTVYAGTR